MILTYETHVTEDGALHLDIKDPKLLKGQSVRVRVTVSEKERREFKRLLKQLLTAGAENNPYDGMSEDEILADLRRVREEVAQEDPDTMMREILRIRQEMGYYGSH